MEKFLATISVLACSLILSGCQTGTGRPEQVLTVEASRGQCQCGMEGTGCDLTIRIEGQTCFVDGFSIDDHGDAHAEDGLCMCVRTAEVKGKIENGRFVATFFRLVAQDK